MANLTVFRDGTKYTLPFEPPMELERALEELKLHFPHPCLDRLSEGM